jgi:hypothetical protein
MTNQPAPAPNTQYPTLKLFSDKAAMEIKIVPNNKSPGFLAMVDATAIDIDASKKAKMHRYDWENKVTVPLVLDGMYGCLLVGSKRIEQYESTTGNAIVKYKRQTNEYSEQYPSVLAVVANNQSLQVRLTPGNHIAFLSMLAKTVADTQKMSVPDAMRLINIFG